MYFMRNIINDEVIKIIGILKNSLEQLKRA